MEISKYWVETPIAQFQAKGKMQSMADEPPRLRTVSFAIHSARGLIRDQTTRRWTMRSGGGGWVYLRGDRQDPTDLGILELH